MVDCCELERTAGVIEPGLVGGIEAGGAVAVVPNMTDGVALALASDEFALLTLGRGAAFFGRGTLC